MNNERKRERYHRPLGKESGKIFQQNHILLYKPLILFLVFMIYRFITSALLKNDCEISNETFHSF